MIEPKDNHDDLESYERSQLPKDTDIENDYIPCKDDDL
jgi:hypothetical protein